MCAKLCAKGSVTCLGLNHRSELNQFNLADDLFEPFRPYLDLYVMNNFSNASLTDLDPVTKAKLVDVLNQDISISSDRKNSHRRTVLSATESVVIEFSRRMKEEKVVLELPLVIPDLGPGEEMDERSLE